MKLAALLAPALLTAGCASYDGHTLVPGESTVDEVEAVMGRPADKRAGPQGETVYWYPQLPYGYASYAARIASDGTLVGVEQRLVEANIVRIQKGWTAEQVYDLLGPPYQPETYPRMERTAWTYPLRVQGYGYPKWFVVYLSTRDGMVVETYLLDDPNYQPRGFFRR